MANPQNPFSDTGQTQFEQDLQTARGWKPVTQTELTQAYQEYAPEGLKFGQVKKSQTDEQLYKRATDIVLAWYKKSKETAKAAPPATSGGDSGGAAAQGGSTGGGGGGTSGGASGGGSSSTSGMPDTAYGTGVSGGGNLPLPHIPVNGLTTPSALIQQAKSLQQQNAATANKPVPLTSSEARTYLNQMGVPKTWNPPSNALSSKEALSAWAQRAAEYAKVVLHNNSLPTYTNQVVQSHLNNLGINNMYASQVPLQYRTSVAKLDGYLLWKSNQIKAALALVHTKAATTNQSGTTTVKTGLGGKALL